MKTNLMTVDEWKIRLGVYSYYGVAKHLGIHESTVNSCDKRGGLIGVCGDRVLIAKEAKQK